MNDNFDGSYDCPVSHSVLYFSSHRLVTIVSLLVICVGLLTGRAVTGGEFTGAC